MPIPKKSELVEPKLTENSKIVLSKRYLRKNEKTRKPIENAKDLFYRVAYSIALADANYGATKPEVLAKAKKFYSLLANLEFLPNSPTLMNAGRKLGQLSGCFVMPVEDNMTGIFESIKLTALVHQSGGGTGFSFNRLRPKDDIVKSTEGRASGPVSFMAVFDSATNTVKQGGKRRGANMGILNINHPDIEEFINCKLDGTSFPNFNISVGITNDFMRAVKENKKYPLINPRNNKVVKRVNAKEIFDKICENAWKIGDPGIIFLDNMNKDNPTPKIGKIESTNPCGEQPLLPFESCNLGSINLAKMVTTVDKKIKFGWDKLKYTTEMAVQFLDNVIDVNHYPIEEISKMTRSNRKIGLGVMGWADLLILLKIPYNSEKAVEFAEKVMKFIAKNGHAMSHNLAKDRGPFPNYKDSVWDKRKYLMRNATVTTIAPTGTISIIAGASSGIEPLFSIVLVRKNVLDNNTLIDTNPFFERLAKEEKFYSKDLVKKLSNNEVHDIDEIPDKFKKILVTAHDINPEWHLKMQAAFQKYTDNAVSKTINFPNSATIDDIIKTYLMAYKMKCKGITIYRDGSRTTQVLNKDNKKETPKEEIVLLNKIIPRKRPDKIFGTTYKIPTGYGNLYVTINEDENNDPFEVFTHIGKAGGFFAAKAEAISRLISLALRCGIDIQEIIDQLKGIRGPNPIWGEKGMVLSMPDAIGQILEKHITKKQEQLSLDYAKKNIEPKTNIIQANSNGGTKEKKLADLGDAPACPDCGGILEMGEGCLTCRFCGFSKCA
jgi:ribonucleoside-diphosphate reductase alpha chain